jgi:hypothetical protein
MYKESPTAYQIRIMKTLNKSISINSIAAREKVCERFNAGFFQAIEFFMIPLWTNGSNSSPYIGLQQES